MSQPHHLTPDTKLSGRYVITRHLGGGGFGQTYMAVDQQLPGHPVCVVKQLQPQITYPEALQIARRLFNTEAEVLYKLGNHDQIPRLLAHFEEDQEFFLVQDYIDGHSLDMELSPGKKLNPDDVVAIALDVLTVLSFVHENNVIHRDIKPTNILRRKQDGKLVLIDFGAVKRVSTGTAIAPGQTTVTVAIGTPGYMPNEQTSGKPRLCSDVYAVGMLANQALTGLMPDRIPEDAHSGELAWHDGVEASPELVSILERMVRYDFRQRYPSATEALQAMQTLTSSPRLEQFASSGVPPIVPPTMPVSSVATELQPPQTKPQRVLGTVPILVLVGGAVGVVAVTGVMIMPIVQNRTQPSKEPIAQPSVPPASNPAAIAQSPNPSSPTANSLQVPSSPVANSPVASPQVSSPPVAPPVQKAQPASGWEFMGSASTGEGVYVDNSSIRTSAGSLQFTYKIGTDVINATADCSGDRWYANGYGWYSPQSAATQKMLQYVCTF